MGAALGLTFAVGLLLVMQALTGPAPRREQVRRRTHDAGEMLRTALQAAGLGIAAALLTLTVLGIPMVALLAGVAAGACPALMAKRARNSRERARQAAWPGAVDDLLTAVRAGVPLPDAICSAAEAGPDPLRPGLARFAATWRRGGSYTEALAAMQRYFSDASADRVIVCLALAAQTGGPSVGRVLATQGDFLRADLRMRGEIDARQSWTVSAARVAVAAPWLAVAALSVRGDSAQAYATPVGAVVLLITAVVGAGAYAAMRRIAALPVPHRLPELQP